MHPLIAEAAKKAAVAWLTVPGAGQAYPVWSLWANDALHVVTGPGEQTAPGLAEAAAGSAEAQVTMTGDHGGRVVRWPATVAVLPADGEDWAAIAPQLAGKRLNAPGGAEQTVRRWAVDCHIYRLTPGGDPDEAGPTLPDGDLTATPRKTPGTRLPRRPFRLHKVRGA
ncbi:MAG: hypothetical protein HKP61_17040 [Dactylosporangium sp.]|nr:hypothetical protein [Dactylosporangium sp.]NNJ62613.1 hypothetical protein [Dactylosporangium sp.]